MADTRRFQGKTALVTGGASGIGLAIARRLAREGARLVLADVNEASLGAARAELGDAIECCVADVRAEAQLEAAVAAAVRRFDGLDVAFNCAGLSVPAPIVEMAEADWDLTVDICLKGVFLAVKHEARRMLAQGRGGAIVNIASLNAHVPMFGGAAYACAKAGVEMLGRNAALELAAHRIRVNTVSPGLTDTPLTATFKVVPGVEEAFFSRIPMRRWGTPEDMAAASLFLASDDAGYISGANLVVDGAWETTGYPDLQPFLEKLLAAGIAPR
jgi:NAD(P)-dependent dehydrogenase (short-subunit alcohol dehydrogenase family)